MNREAQELARHLAQNRMMPPEPPMVRTGGLAERIRTVVNQLLSGEDF